MLCDGHPRQPAAGYPPAPLLAGLCEMLLHRSGQSDNDGRDACTRGLLPYIPPCGAHLPPGSDRHISTTRGAPSGRVRERAAFPWRSQARVGIHPGSAFHPREAAAPERPTPPQTPLPESSAPRAFSESLRSPAHTIRKNTGALWDSPPLPALPREPRYVWLCASARRRPPDPLTRSVPWGDVVPPGLLQRQTRLFASATRRAKPARMAADLTRSRKSTRRSWEMPLG